MAPVAGQTSSQQPAARPSAGAAGAGDSHSHVCRRRAPAPLARGKLGWRVYKASAVYPCACPLPVREVGPSARQLARLVTRQETNTVI